LFQQILVDSLPHTVLLLSFLLTFVDDDKFYQMTKSKLNQTLLILYFESRRFVERDCVSFEDDDVFSKLDFGDGNDETNLTRKRFIRNINTKKGILTASAAFAPEHTRNLSIHFCLSLASFAT
jgi:hypothetical protein